jgi:hypothetical protein
MYKQASGRFLKKAPQKLLLLGAPARGFPSCRTWSGIHDFLASQLPTPIPPGQKSFAALFFRKATAYVNSKAPHACH